MMKHLKHIRALTLFAGLTFLALTGCPQAGSGAGTGGSGSTAEKKEFSAAVTDPKGTLKVSVDGTNVAASFESEGKTYAGTGTLGQDGAAAVDLVSQADTANKYRFAGTYDSAKKSFTKAQFGKENALKDVSFDGKDSGKPRTLYTGTVHGFGLQEYDITILVKSETSATILFSKKTGFDTDYGKDHPLKRETVYYEVQGTLNGNKLTADVRLEGEDFKFETVLNGDGYLRETRLIGERALTGDRNPTFIYEYEAKGIDYTVSAAGTKKTSNRNVAARFNGNLSITIHLSIASFRNMNDKRLKSKEYDSAEIGRVFVSFVDLTEKTAGTRRYKMFKTLTRKNYKDGLMMTLYNVLDRRSEIADYDPSKLTPEQRKEYENNLGTIESGRVATAFVFTCPKDWFDFEKQDLKVTAGTKPVAFKFGRAQSYNKFMDNSAVAEIPVSLLKRVK